MVHNGFKLNISGAIQQLEARIEENISSSEDSEPDVVCSTQINAKWIAPEVGTIKLNVDAATSNGKAVIAVVARNHHGEVIKAWSKLCTLGSPLITEASAIQWVMQLAVSKK